MNVWQSHTLGLQSAMEPSRTKKWMGRDGILVTSLEPGGQALPETTVCSSLIVNNTAPGTGWTVKESFLWLTVLIQS